MATVVSRITLLSSYLIAMVSPYSNIGYYQETATELQIHTLEIMLFSPLIAAQPPVVLSRRQATQLLPRVGGLLEWFCARAFDRQCILPTCTSQGKQERSALSVVITDLDCRWLPWERLSGWAANQVELGGIISRISFSLDSFPTNFWSRVGERMKV